MAAKFKKGSAVRKVVPDIVGEVIDAQLNKETLGIRYLVEYTDSDNSTHQRYFEEEELQSEPEKTEE